MIPLKDDASEAYAPLPLLQRAGNGEPDAEEELVRRNMPLVYAIVRRFAARGAEREDLVQLGSIGLLKAIRRFDASYGVRFSTYAVPLIAGEIKRFLRDDGMIKYTRTVKQLAVRISALSLSDGDMSVDELAENLGCKAEDAAIALSCSVQVSSLDAALPGGTVTLGEMQPAPDDRDVLVERMYLSELMERLDKREKLIMQLRYGHDMTQKETAARLGLSQVQISRLEKRIMLKLKEAKEGA